MAVIVIHDVPGGTHEMMEGARQAGVIDKLKAAPEDAFCEAVQKGSSGALDCRLEGCHRDNQRAPSNRC